MPTLIGKMLTQSIGPWKGMNEKVSPDTLPPGVAADLQNVLLDEIPGEVVKRQGRRKLAALPSGLPPRDRYVFTKLDGTSYFLISDGSTLYYTTDPAGTYTALIGGLNPDGFMSFETAENKVWMSNGIDAVMSWNGTTLVLHDRSQTVTAASVAVTSTTIRNAALTQTDDYWNNQKLVFTSGANIGTVVTVTDFDASSDTLTFSPSVSGITINDDFIVGVEIPRGASQRYYDGHMFEGSTADNQAELRFSEISDPDTGEVMTLDNPRAWPAANELALNVLDQEKLYGISPILRDRVLVHKSTGLFRLERDPLVTYRLEVVTRGIGSRFPDTWAEKNNLLYFLGQNEDGYPDIFKTDMVDVSPVDPDGGIEPTLRDLQQPNAVFQNRTFTSQSDFDAGSKSTALISDNGQLMPGGYGADISLLGDALVSAANIDLETTPGHATLLGAPIWATRYEADALPQSAVPAWTVNAGRFAAAVASSVLTITQSTAIVLGSDSYSMTLNNVLESGKDLLLALRVKIRTGTVGPTVLTIQNGQYQAVLTMMRAGFGTTLNGASSATTVQDNSYHVVTVLLKSTGAAKMWLDGTLLLSDTTASATTGNMLKILVNGNTSAASDITDIDYLYWHTDFKGDGLQSLSGKVSPVAMPSTLPSSGNFVVLNNLQRAPDALLRVYQASTLYGGTVALESWTAGVSDFSTETDPAGYLSVANGAIPTSQVKQYQRLRTTLTRADVALAPDVSALYTGTLWLSPAISLGTEISLWRTFLATLSTPSGVDQTVKIRSASTTSTPGEGDYGAWVAITNGNNIGTILGDATPPNARWVQLKVEQGPSSGGDRPYVDSLVIQWTEGSAVVLPISGVVHKKRYMLCAATSGVSQNDIVIVCDRNDQWTKFIGWSLNGMIHYQSNFYGLDADDAKVSLLDVSGVYNDDGGVAIDAFLVDREEDFGAAHLRKDIRNSYLHCGRPTAAWTLTTSYRRSGDTAFTGSGTFSFGVTGLDVRQNFPSATLGRMIQRKYRNAVLDENMSFCGETLSFMVKPPIP